MTWLVPFSALTPEQQEAVYLDDDKHKVIIGGPGAGKSLVLLHRLSYFYEKNNNNPDAVHLFVYTTSLKDFIKSSTEIFNIPEKCITTFDKWCVETYKKYISTSLPYTQSGNYKMPDFAKIRTTLHEQITTKKLNIPLYSAVLVDEAQDMERPKVRIGFPSKHHFEQMTGVVRQPVDTGIVALKPARHEIDGQGEAVHLGEQGDDESAEATEGAPVARRLWFKEAEGEEDEHRGMDEHHAP